MSDGTRIEWTDATWNPIRARVPGSAFRDGWHCERVSPGCQHCYAERLNEDRFGTMLPYTRPSRERVEVYVHEAALVKPLHWKKPRRVFVCSMTDLFGEWVTDEQIDGVFAVMALSPQHTFQVLTKRPERMRAYLTTIARHNLIELAAEPLVGGKKILPRLPLPNVWLGVSAEDQQRWDERVPELLATPAAVRFVSCEPLLGPIDARARLEHPDGDPLCTGYGDTCRSGIHWLIVGGESGPGARPCDVAWIRSLVGQCQAAGVSVFVKQLGARPLFDRDELPTSARFCEPYGERFAIRLRDSKGGDMSEWPADLRVREFPR